MKLRLALLIAWVPVLAFAQEKVDLNTITKVEVKGGSVEITGNKKPNFTTFTMTDPPRLVIDISEAVFSGVPEEMQVGNGTVTAIKTASYGSDAAAIARVLIGFEKDVETDIQTVGDTKLVVKVAGGAGPAVAAAEPAKTEDKAAKEAAAAAAEKAAQEKAAKEAAATAAAEKAAQEKAAKEAQAQAEKDKKAQEKAEKEAAAKAEKERIAQEKADKLAAAKAEKERIAQEKQAEKERIAQEKADKLAAAKAEKERVAQEKQAEKERIAQEKADKLAAAKAEKEQAAQAKAGEQPAAGEQAAQAEAEPPAKSQKQLAAEAKAAAAEEKRLAAQQAKEEKAAAAQRAKEEKAAAAQAAAEEKAARAEEKKLAAQQAKEAKQQPQAVAMAEHAERPSSGGGEISVSGRRKTMQLVGFKQDVGASRVFVRTNEPVRYSVSEAGDKTLVLELENTRIQTGNDHRPLDTSYFDTAVALVTPNEGPTKTVRIQIKLKESVAYQARQDGNEVSLEFQRPGHK